jgi:tripartite-type tricarboxylate transporter receptor subunit TctC
MHSNARVPAFCAAIAVAVGAALTVSPSALAQSNGAIADAFKGKTITVYVGLSPGGGYDTNARVLAKHMGRHVPGEPTVIVKNMPGGGGLVMTSYVANVAPKDGLHIGAPQRGVPFEPLTGGDVSHAKFDPLALNWLGSMNADTSVSVATRASGVKTWQDLKKKELIVAGTGVGTESVVVPYVLRSILGLKYKVIAGYPGSNEMNLAMQRSEVFGRGTVTWTSVKPHKKEWIDSGDQIILFQMGLKKHPDLSDVPLIIDLAETDEQRTLLELEFTGFQLGRPYFLPAGVPADRVTALRRAFDATMKDKDLIAEATKLDLEVNATTGEDMQDILKRVYATPKALVDKLAEASKYQPDLQVIKGAEGAKE